MKRIRLFFTICLAVVAFNLPAGCLCMPLHLLLHKDKSHSNHETKDSKKKGEKESEEGKSDAKTQSEKEEKAPESPSHTH